MPVSRKNHNPSIARRIVREIKEGQSPETLISIAKDITDPYYLSLSQVSIASNCSLKPPKAEKLFKSAFSNYGKVNQSWRRIELLGEISKRMKNIKDSELKYSQYNKILSLSHEEKKEDTKNFFVKHSKTFPSINLEKLLTFSVKIKGYEFESSKAVIRSWLNKGQLEPLISHLSELKGDLRVKLLGYLHFQISKSKTNVSTSPLEIALKSTSSEEMFRYLVRVSSKPSDLKLIESSISDEPLEISVPISIALIARADRKGWNQEAHHFASNAEKLISSMQDSEIKEKFNSKLKITTDRLTIESPTAPPSPKKPMAPISDSGKHTLGLYNTYGGNWNHPHYKAVFKAANLCSAFDLNLALIDFPNIESGRLISEIKKEMRLPNEGYLSQLFSKDRVRFFDKDIDESWAGSKVVTTANPEPKKQNLPDGKLCMIMGLGPKGLPKSYLGHAPYQFEITGTGVAFETGTAMGAIAGHLSLL